jgi:hypothetical protein
MTELKMVNVVTVPNGDFQEVVDYDLADGTGRVLTAHEAGVHYARIRAAASRADNALQAAAGPAGKLPA